MNVIAMWRLHKLCVWLRRYPHEVVPGLTEKDDLEIFLVGSAIERARKESAA